MGNSASIEPGLEPKQSLSQEMIATGNRIGRVALALRALRANVVDKQREASEGSEKIAVDQNSSPAWNFLKSKPKQDEPLNVDQLKKVREQEAHQLQMDDPYYHHTRAFMEYDVLLEEDMDIQQCGYCNIVNRNEVCDCRICGVSYHRDCLVRRGLVGQDMNSSQALNDAVEIGWSCSDCEDLSDLIPHNDVSELMETFDLYDRSGRSVMTLEDYMRIERQNNISKREIQRKFVEYDRDNDGRVTWNEYIMTEAVNYLKKQPQNALLKLLKPKEVHRMRVLFRERDPDNTGIISVQASEQVYRTWLKSLGISAAEEFRKSEERSSGANVTRLITWERFIRNKAISIITARPNTRTIRPYIVSMHVTAL